MYFNRYSDPLTDVDPSLGSSVGVIRKDEVVILEIGMGYQFRRSMRAVVGFNYDRRKSNITQDFSPDLSGQLVDPFDTRVHRLFLRLEMGWL